MATFIDLDSVWRDRDNFPNGLDYTVLPSQIATWVRSSREVRALPQGPNQRPLDFVSSVNIPAAVLPYPRIELFAPTLITVDSITGGTTLNTLTPHLLVINDIVMTSSPGFASSNGIQRNVEYHVIATPTPTSFLVSLTAGGPPVALIDGTGLAMILGVITPANYATTSTNLTSALQLVTFPRIYLDVHSRQYDDQRAIRAIDGHLSDAKFILTQDKIQFDDTMMPIWIHYKSHGEQILRFKRDDTVQVRFLTRDGTVIPFFTETDLTIPTNPDKQSMITLEVTPYIRDADYSHHNTNPISY